MIPARLRSNSSWLILFKLNPNDMDNVYSDVVTLPSKTWERVTKFVFGEDEMLYNTTDFQGLQQMMRAKKFENLGIWVEHSIYFKNF